MTDWKKNQTFTCTIEGYTAQGEGVARVDGRPIFIPNTISGEEWEVNLVKTHKNFAYGRGVTRLTDSEHRTDPDCYFSEKCGGCQYRHMDYTEELRAKHDHLKNALSRIGGITAEVPPILGAEEISFYRNKIQYPVAMGKRGISIGFYRARSHQLIDINICQLQPPKTTEVRELVKDWMKDFGVTPYDESTQKGMVRHLYLRTNAKGEVLVCVVATKKRLPAQEILVERLEEAIQGLVGVVINVNREDTNVVLGKKNIILWGKSVIEEELCGLTFSLSLSSFFQVNLAQTEVLYNTVADFAELTGKETVIDLYCGIGTISLFLAKQAKKVIGAELVESSILDARSNAERNKIKNAEFLAGDVAAVAVKLSSEGVAPDVIVLDPPRKGLAPEVPHLLASMKAKKMVYVSCDPGTLARDLKKFEELGYGVAKVQGVDLFPRTRHVETVVLLVKK
ncbi:MAG: 23S rRNA (uracil(1939)-C(5))-methyltransferase RlmD [Eubacteriales bacterium]